VCASTSDCPVIPRLLLYLAPLLLLLASCVQAPKAPSVKKPFWSFTQSTEKRIASQLATAAAAWDIWNDGSQSAAKRKKAEADYENSVAAILETWNDRQQPRHWQTGSVFTSPKSSYQLSLQPAPGNPQEVSPLMLDQLRLAKKIYVSKARDVTEPGIGVPIVGEVAYSPALAQQYPLMPLNGGHLTLTALIEFDPAPIDASTPRQARLHLYNPLRKPTIQLGQRTIALEANYSAAKKLALDNGFLRGFSLIGALFPEKTIANSKLYRLELHDPQRIPVTFVHGVLSDPHIWYPCINAIYADPVLRAHYQPWYFLYPTGMAVPATARRLRESLKEARTQLDPDHNDPGLDHMVLVGHSMGGLLSRLQAIDSGDDFWKAYFKRPPAELNLTAASRERLTESLIFNKEPDIKRLIFITVPQRGSAVADKGIIYRLSTLIRLPVDSLLLVKEVLSGNNDALNPQIRDWGMFAFLSSGTLSPKHPYFEALNRKPIPVPHHSIIGRVGNKPLQESSDRVVPYSSSHLNTGTEKIVPCWHVCLEEKAVIDEVLKRLHEHLKTLGRE
jgi:pimeloyl-ACP methyl ester carboxylesterase